MTTMTMNLYDQFQTLPLREKVNFTKKINEDLQATNFWAEVEKIGERGKKDVKKGRIRSSEETAKILGIK